MTAPLPADQQLKWKREFKRTGMEFRRQDDEVYMSLNWNGGVVAWDFLCQPGTKDAKKAAEWLREVAELIETDIGVP